MPADDDTIHEERLIRLEEEFVRLSGTTCSTAYQSALQAGLTVLVSKGDQVVEVSPDGTERPVKTIIGPSPVQPGSKYILR